MHRFGDCELDEAARELRRGGSSVHLEPQAFDLLAELVRHRDRVMTKVELLDGVWGHRFLSDANLTTRIKEIRQAVGDDGVTQHTIRTVRGRGYRFVAAVHDPHRSVELLGRSDLMASVRDALRSSALVTITGPGGVGKSSLAREVIADLAGGAQLVELSTVDPGTPVLDPIAGQLDVVVPVGRGRDALRAIGQLDTLLVLDNCEHLADEVAVFIDELLASHPRIRILATSQVPLGLGIEAVVAVGPLHADDARSLFERRARAVQPTWSIAAVGSERVDRLVAALDRLPLTIEMAAARLGSMTFDDLERAVGEQAPLLQVTHRTSTRRHRSLESLTGWSAGLLADGERELFTDVSVFAGWFTAADANAVVGDLRRPDATLSALTVRLGALSERSLLATDMTAHETRYVMLSTVRTVGSKWLDDVGRTPAVRGRHAAYIAQEWDDIDHRIRTPDEASARVRADAIVAETRAAHRWARSHDAELADSMLRSLHHVAYQGLWHEPSVWAADLVTTRSDAIGATLVLAAAAAHRGDLAVARQWCRPALGNPDAKVRAIANEVLADVALYAGQLDAATLHATAMHDLGLELDDAHFATFAVVDAALAEAYAGRPVEAITLVDRFMADRRELALSDRAWLHYTRGDALSLAHDASAADEFERALQLGLAVDSRFVVSVSHTALAAEFARRGTFDLAIDTYVECLTDHLRHGNFTHAVTAMRNLVSLLTSLGDDRSAVVVGAAMSNDHLRISYGIEAETLAEELAAVRARVGTAKYTAWFEEGQPLDVASAVQAALDALIPLVV